MRDPELSYTPKGTATCKFSIGVNRTFKVDAEEQKETSYLDIVAWARLAEICGEYLKKGRGVRVIGRLKQDRWETPDGQKRSKIVIVAERVEFKPQSHPAAEDNSDAPLSPEAERVIAGGSEAVPE